MADAGQALQGGMSGAVSGASMGTSILPGWGTAIGAAGGALMGALPALLGDESEEANKKRLAQLKAMMENNTLGLTEPEKNSLYDKLLSQNQAQIDKMTADRNRQLSSAINMGAGQGFNSMISEEESTAKARTDVARTVQAEDLKRKREMEQEYYARVAGAGERTKQRQDAGASAGIGILGAITDKADLDLMTGGPASGKTASGLASKYGISEGVATGLLGDVAKNPELLSLFELLGGA